jgi:hypothetical protein
MRDGIKVRREKAPKSSVVAQINVAAPKSIFHSHSTLRISFNSSRHLVLFTRIYLFAALSYSFLFSTVDSNYKGESKPPTFPAFAIVALLIDGFIPLHVCLFPSDGSSY